ncbi:putative replication protein [Zea mays]|uniref:Putative replication protein n=1 Tax=Zea mays TaxID=4577 RepID=A0A1D6ME93_MAIZE|nr:putative replication protein [Zea mays]
MPSSRAVGRACCHDLDGSNRICDERRGQPELRRTDDAQGRRVGCGRRFAVSQICYVAEGQTRADPLVVLSVSSEAVPATIEHMNTLDQPSASAPAHVSRYAISLRSQQVRQKRPGDKSLLDFPTTVANANRHHRKQRMRRTPASAERACANNGFSLTHVFPKIIFWFHIWCALKKVYEILLAFLLIVSTDGASPPLERSYIELLKETYKDRSYYGGPSDECPHCGAVFWFQERVKSVSAVTQRRLVYNLCCRGGKIVLEPYKCPPTPLCDLLRFDSMVIVVPEDVLGVVSVISRVSSLHTRGRQAEVMKRTVTISNARDTGPTVDVVLWGERATTFPAEQVHRDSESSPQIIIFVGTLVRSYAGNLLILGFQTYNFQLSSSPNLITVIPKLACLNSAETNHLPVIWDQGKAAAESTVIAVPEHKKLKDIKYLHHFENKKKEWLVIVKVLKIDSSWWYNACKKCLRTTKPHGDTYKCTNNSSGQGSGVAQNKGAAFIREPSLTPESHKVSSSAKCDLQTAPHQGANLLLGTEIITTPPNMQTPSGAAYSVLDGSTNKTHKSVTGKRSRTSPSKKVAKKLFRDDGTGDDDAAGSADVDAE